MVDCAFLRSCADNSVFPSIWLSGHRKWQPHGLVPRSPSLPKRKTISDKPSAIFTQLEDLDYADDLAILHKSYSPCKKRQIGLTVMFKPIQTYLQNPTPHTPISVDSNSPFKEFTYLESLLSKDNACIKDICIGFRKALKVHLQAFKPSGSQSSAAWRLGSKCRTAMSNPFCCMAQNAGVRLRVTWKRCFSQWMCLGRSFGCQNVALEVKHRQLQWLGHGPGRIPKVSMRWEIQVLTVESILSSLRVMADLFFLCHVDFVNCYSRDFLKSLVQLHGSRKNSTALCPSVRVEMSLQ